MGGNQDDWFKLNDLKNGKICPVLGPTTLIHNMLIWNILSKHSVLLCLYSSTPVYTPLPLRVSSTYCQFYFDAIASGLVIRDLNISRHPDFCKAFVAL